MELRHLRYFVTVAEEQNVTKAAARLHVAQPPLSRQIRDLERELGVSLFERSAKGVRLTEAGETFLVEARGVLLRAEGAVERAQEVALGKRGKVRVGHAPSSVAILRRALGAFSQSHPHVSVDLQEMGMGMLRGLRDGTLDVAISAALSPDDFEGLAVETLESYAMLVAMSRKHRFARLRAVPLRDLAKEPIIGRSRKEHPYVHAYVHQILEPYTRSPNFVEEYDSFESVIAAVEAGRGVTVVAEVVAQIAGKRMVLRPMKPAPPVVPIVMAYRKDGLSAAATAFLTATRAVVAKRSRSTR